MNIISSTEHRYINRGEVFLRVTEWHEKLPPTEMKKMLDDGYELHTFFSPFLVSKAFTQDPEQDSIAKEMLEATKK